MNKPNRNRYRTNTLQDTSTDPHTSYYAGRELELKVVGVTFNGRQAVVRSLEMGEAVLLRREPSNHYDGNAIRVEKMNGEQIGYISRHLAAALAPFFDGYGQAVKGVVSMLTGGMTYLGVSVRFTVPEFKTEEKGA